MTQNENQALYQLFRDHEGIMGASQTTLVVLESLATSIKKLKCTNDTFKVQVMKLVEVIKNSEPRIIPLVHLIEQFESEMGAHFGKPLEEAKERSIVIINGKMSLLRSNMQRVSENGMALISEGEDIIVHSPSAVVKDALIGAHERRKIRFKVIVLKQDFIKTKQLISSLAAAGIELMVIPEYNLSHSFMTADKLFIGAVSVTSDRQLVAAPGTANVVGLCHLNKIPIYLLINTLKFAHKAIETQHIHRKQEAVTQDDITYKLTAFSHDKVDLNLIDHVITEEGKIALDVPWGPT